MVDVQGDKENAEVVQVVVVVTVNVVVGIALSSGNVV